MKKLIFSGCFLLMAAVMFAQPGGDLPSEQVEVLKTFDAQLAKSDKLNTTPTLPPVSSGANSSLRYAIKTRLLSLDYEAPVIRPIPVKREKPPKAKHFFTRLGYGTPNSPYLEAIYNGGEQDNLRYDVRGKFHSANNTNNIENQRFIDADFGAKAIYYTPSFAIGGNAGYDFDQYHFYGYDNGDTTFLKDSVLQNFKTLKLGAELFNSSITQGDISYSGKVDFYNLSDNYDATETGIKAGFELTKWMKDNAFVVKLVNDFSTFSGDTAMAANNVLSFMPSFNYNADAFSVKVGGNIGLDSTAYVFPDVEASVNVAQEKLVLIAGWTGEVQKNNLQNITNYNPFVHTAFTQRNTRMQKRYVGMRGSVSKVNYEFTVAQKPTTNLAMYLNDSMDTRRFDVIYDDATIFSIHGALGVHELIENLDLSGSIDVHTYNMENEARAWHLPNFEMNVTAKYKLLEDKLGLKAEVFTMSGVPYLDANQTEQTLNNLLDLSFGAEYKATENIGVFLNLNNVTNQQFLRWNNYPTFGFNVLGGITARF